MSEHQARCGPYSEIVCKSITGFISLAYHLIFHHLDIISRHFAAAFNIPVHNTGIYFNKLYSLRCLSLVVSGFLENCIFQASGGDRNPQKSMKVRRYVAVVCFTLHLTVRVVYLFLLYGSSNLAYHIYIILILEGFCFGLQDAGFMTLESEYMSIITAFYNAGRLLVLLCQFILDMIWFERPLLMVKIQAWICVILTFIAVGLWYYYNLYIQIGHGRSPEKVLEILRQPGESVFDKLVEGSFPGCLKEPLEKRAKALEMANQLEQDIAKDRGEGNGLEQPRATARVETIMSEFKTMCDGRLGIDGIGAAISPVILYWSITMVKDFLYPATLPYGLLQRDKCHMINMLAPVAILVGPLVLFILDNFTHFLACWSWVYDIFFFLYVPVPVIFTFAILAIHTRIPAARAIINSRPRVMAMTLMLMLSFGFLETISWIGLGKYASRDNPGGYTLMGFHINASFLCRSIFSRVSVGYSDTRISLGYHLPKFRPNHKMSRSNLRWYLFKQTFKRAWADAKGDFRLDIKKYL